MARFAPKYIPNRDELADCLRSLSAQAYPDHPTWGVTRSQFDEGSAGEWSRANTILGHYGHEPNATGWQDLVRELTGLEVQDTRKLAAVRAAAQAGYIPTKEELGAHLVGLRMDNPFAGLGMNAYSDTRPDGWAGPTSICLANGEPPNAAGWQRIIREATGLAETRGNKLSSNPLLDRYPGPLPQGEREAARSWRSGMACRPRLRSVRVWCHRTETYVETEQQEWLELV